MLAIFEYRNFIVRFCRDRVLLKLWAVITYCNQ